jgi:hypothetical protein
MLVWYKADIISSNVTCSRHDIAEKMLIYCCTITFPRKLPLQQKVFITNLVENIKKYLLRNYQTVQSH